MARKVFISFLGTGKYKPCCYVDTDSGFDSGVVHYVQAALVDRHCKDWTAADRAFILLTEEAKAKNWLTNNADDTTKGLQQILHDQQDLSIEVIPVDVPDYNSESGIWELFDILYQLFEDGDEVYFDITHSFRFLPMLMTVLLSYSKTLKGIKVESISYGSFETLGPAYQIDREIPDPNNRKAPILELSGLAELQDWTQATSDFLKYGRGEALYHMVNAGAQQLFKQDQREKGMLYSQLGKELKKITEYFLANRGVGIHEGNAFKKLRRLIEDLTDLSEVKAVHPLLDQIKESTRDFAEGDWRNGLRATKWCIDHQLIPQGYTLLQETICTYVTTLHADLDYDNKRHRQLASDALHIKGRSIARANWRTKDPEIVHTLLSLIPDAPASVYNSLSDLRNDVNHAGFNANRNFAKLKSQLTSCYHKFNEIL